MSSVETTEAMSQAVQKTPNRVSLDSIRAKISNCEVFHPKSTPHMTILAMTMTNGFVVIGKSAPADPGNFDADLGRKFAEEDAIRQLWQLEGYLLRQNLNGDANAEETQPVETEAETQSEPVGESEPEPTQSSGQAS